MCHPRGVNRIMCLLDLSHDVWIHNEPSLDSLATYDGRCSLLYVSLNVHSPYAMDVSLNAIYFVGGHFCSTCTWQSMQDAPIQILFSRLVVFRSTPFGADAWRSVGEAAGYTGRFHGHGEPLPLYTSSSELATLRELELHAASPLEPSREILRRVTAIGLAAGSRLLIADHRDTLAATGFSLGQIYNESDYEACHAVAEYAAGLPGVVGVTTQSNAEREQRTIAILPSQAKRATAMVDYWEGSLNLLRRAFAHPTEI